MQGLMFGYATDETPEYMPLTLQLAHQINRKIAELRRDGTLWWARPDSKAQVTAEYRFEQGACVPIRVHTVVVSCQHSEKVTLEALRKDIMEKVINTTIPKKVRHIYIVSNFDHFLTILFFSILMRTPSTTSTPAATSSSEAPWVTPG